MPRDCGIVVAESEKWQRRCGATALGQLFPAVLITAFGVVLGGSIGPDSLANGIEYSLLEKLPAWLAPLFVLGVL